jgi:hypothetical protein
MLVTRKLSLLIIAFFVVAFAQTSTAKSEKSMKSAKSTKSMKSINCDKEGNDQKKIQKTLDRARSGSVISLSGTCEGLSLVVKTDGITVHGPADLRGNGNEPVVRVQDAGDINLVDLELSDGDIGLEVANSRVNALDVTANNNVSEGFTMIRHGNLVCTNCEAKGNGSRGMLVIGSATLCGTGVFAENGIDGVLVFLGGKAFSSASVCGGIPDLDLIDNGQSGLSVVQGGGVFMDEVDLEASSNDLIGITVFDSSSVVVRRSEIKVEDNGYFGLNVSSGQVRLNETNIGNTSIRGNGFFGVQLSSNSFTLFGATTTITANGFLDALVSDFSNVNGTFPGAVNVDSIIICEPGQSSGTLCSF